MPRTYWTCALAVLLMTACGDSTSPADDPPALPQVESLNVDLETFPSAGTPAAGPALTSHIGHHAVAAITVGVTNLVVAAHLIVPVAAWRAARASVPTLENGEWHWRFPTTALAVNYTGDLVGFVEDGDVVVEMRLSDSQGLSDFVWYTGRAPVGGTTGTWEFFEPAMPGVVTGRIDWSHPGTAVWTVSFVATQGANIDDTLTYAVDGTMRTMTYFDASAGITPVIHWDAASREGYIEAPNYNGGVRACWDEDLDDSTCP